MNRLHRKIYNIKRPPVSRALFPFVNCCDDTLFYLTLLNNCISTHSLSVCCKGPVLLLVKLWCGLLNKMSLLDTNTRPKGPVFAGNDQKSCAHSRFTLLTLSCNLKQQNI